MEVDDEIHHKLEYEMDAISAELNTIDELDNICKLDLLIKESIIIEKYSIIYTEKWYKERIGYIKMLNLDYLIEKFNGINLSNFYSNKNRNGFTLRKI